jgi:hypothetical protein
MLLYSSAVALANWVALHIDVLLLRIESRGCLRICIASDRVICLPEAVAPQLQELLAVYITVGMKHVAVENRVQAIRQRAEELKLSVLDELKIRLFKLTKVVCRPTRLEVLHCVSSW